LWKLIRKREESYHLQDGCQAENRKANAKGDYEPATYQENEPRCAKPFYAESLPNRVVALPEENRPDDNEYFENGTGDDHDG